MVEKIITLDNISLIDFLGVENDNINAVAEAFPESKIVSRGDEIPIKGNAPEILKINDILNDLVKHYHKYGKVTKEWLSQMAGNRSMEASEIFFIPKNYYD